MNVYKLTCSTPKILMDRGIIKTFYASSNGLLIDDDGLASYKEYVLKNTKTYRPRFETLQGNNNPLCELNSIELLQTVYPDNTACTYYTQNAFTKSEYDSLKIYVQWTVNSVLAVACRSLESPM